MERRSADVDDCCDTPVETAPFYHQLPAYIDEENSMNINAGGAFCHYEQSSISDSIG